MDNKPMNKFGIEEIHAIRAQWAELPQKEYEAEQKKLLASAKRRIARIRKQKTAARSSTSA